MITEFDAIVVGAGHAGAEAGLSLARKGHTTLILTINLEAVGFLACNPSIGGTSKGQLVSEIDALGGQMGISSDRTAIQMKMLNSAKGPAVQSLRAQIDKVAYHIDIKKELESVNNLYLKQGEASELIVEDDKICGIKTCVGDVFKAKCVIICSGVYLKSRIIIGEYSEYIGPSGFKNAGKLSDSLIKNGIELRRFKTGTPARILSDSIDFSKTEEQLGDDNIQTFSRLTKEPIKNVAKCYLTYTNLETHKILMDNLSRAPLYNGFIHGLGPRYCPSIEDKIVRFKDKERHQLFLEPESMTTKEIYLQGLSTSMPSEIQHKAIASVKGLENAFVMRDAYAIEYDCIDSLTLLPTLESKIIKNLYFAGQINGTSGYEEAAAQGLMAGINAGLKLEGKEPFILKRSDAYIGVLIDDLVTKGTNEPYRMMTSRAEFRLHLRQDNADLRLTKFGIDLGLVTKEREELYYKKLGMIEKAEQSLKRNFSPAKVNPLLDSINETKIISGISCLDLLKRKNVTAIDVQKFLQVFDGINDEVLEIIETKIKYMGYIERANEQIVQMEKLENTKLDINIDYIKIKGIRIEAQQKLNKIKPMNIAQASRISGVSPADITVLMIWLKKRKEENDG